MKSFFKSSVEISPFTVTCAIAFISADLAQKVVNFQKRKPQFSDR